MKLVLAFLFWCLVMMLLAAPWADAQTSARLDSLRIAVYRDLLLPDTGTSAATTTRLNGIVNRSIRQVCLDFPAIEKSDTVTADSSSESFSLNSDCDRVRAVFRVVGDTVRVPLEPVMGPEDTLFSWPKIKSAHDPKDITQPRSYHVHGNQIKFFPKYYKSSFSTFVVDYYAVDTGLTADASETSVIQRYREAVLEYAAAKTCAMLGLWTEEQHYSAKYYRRLQTIPKPPEAEGRQ